MSDSERGRGGYDEPNEYEYDVGDDEYHTYEALEEEEGGRSPLMLISIVVLILVFAGVVFLAYQRGLEEGANVPPVLQADDMPFKIAPEDPGGMEIPHQDKRVYDRIAGEGESSEPTAERLLPRAEEPVTLPKAAPAQPSEEASAPPAETAKVQPAPAAPEPAPQPAKTAEAAAAPSGGHVAQLAAFRDQESAERAFTTLQKKYPDLLGALSRDIQRADLGDKGIYYRLRAGPIEKAAAETLCAKLKDRGQGCLVRPL